MTKTRASLFFEAPLASDKERDPDDAASAIVPAFHHGNGPASPETDVNTKRKHHGMPVNYLKTV
ncbi:hypothetical protein DPMN_179526 [Dreissena polymorpha]|uniref:Uncharacterized protein n=1 Tax=Dreissena polymorpha TaxID=45954 RepID=A0A9D4EE69_DREPO|nr:hypothetical protein DPMN_179526 [Dreissena polymorpha]